MFQDSNGIAIKFFIQKDLPTELQAELCETITVRVTPRRFAPLDRTQAYRLSVGVSKPKFRDRVSY